MQLRASSGFEDHGDVGREVLHDEVEALRRFALTTKEARHHLEFLDEMNQENNVHLLRFSEKKGLFS